LLNYTNFLLLFCGLFANFVPKMLFMLIRLPHVAQTWRTNVNCQILNIKLLIMLTIEEVLRIAIDAHEGEKDLDGKPVILHPLAVGLAGRNREEMVAGFLHDVVEDTRFTFDDLLEMGVETEVVDALRLLTHEKGTDYYAYVQRIIDSANPIALAVKRNDLNHNLARGRAGGHTRQVTKHEKALAMLDAV